MRIAQRGREESQRYLPELQKFVLRVPSLSACLTESDRCVKAQEDELRQKQINSSRMKGTSKHERELVLTLC